MFEVDISTREAFPTSRAVDSHRIQASERSDHLPNRQLGIDISRNTFSLSRLESSRFRGHRRRLFRSLANERVTLEWSVAIRRPRSLIEPNVDISLSLAETRTAGLCYGSSIENAVESGFLGLSIYRSPNAITALDAIRTLFASIVKGKTRIVSTEVEAAKSQIAYATVESESTPAKAVSCYPSFSPPIEPDYKYSVRHRIRSSMLSSSTSLIASRNSISLKSK
jgi:hypothetical protein